MRPWQTQQVAPVQTKALEQRLQFLGLLMQGAFRILPFFLSKVFERIEVTNTSLNPGGYP
jgi:hypothetical protein